MIREDLLEFKYYIHRLSKFMQESYGISEHVRLFWTFLKQIDDYYNEFFDQINIFGNYNYQENQTILIDKIGELFGCKRHFTIINNYHSGSWTPAIGDTISIDLEDDVEYIFYIKTQIIKQNFDGSRETLQKLYSTFLEENPIQGLIPLQFVYLNNDNAPANCSIYWNIDDNTTSFSTSLKALFYNNYLTIESMGIIYQKVIANILNTGIFYESGTVEEYNQFYQDGVGGAIFA